MIAGLFTILALFAGILLFEAPALLRKKYWRELAVFLFIWGFSLTLALLLAFNIPVPNPLDYVTFLFKYVFKVIKI